MNCLDCGHPGNLHRNDATAVCLLCLCGGLHLDVGDCTEECYEVNYRTCDECDKVEPHDDCSPFDWVNGVCETCDPSILTLPENAWRVEMMV